MVRLVALVVIAFALLCAACSNGAESKARATTADASGTAAAIATATPAAIATALATASPAPAVAARVPPTVVLDPGHAADEIGASAYGVVEKDSNLDMAFRVERLLQERGVRVVLTRRTDPRVNSGPPVTGYSATRLDLQARIDLANAEGADLFVSLHSNGSSNADDRGVEVWYNASRPFSSENRALAQAILDSVLREMAGAGYPTTNRGIQDDACLRLFQGRCFPLFVLGPGRLTTRDEVLRRGGSPEALGFAPGQDGIQSRPTQMPGALAELLFISNPADAALLKTEAARDALARGVASGIVQYLAQRGR